MTQRDVGSSQQALQFTAQAVMFDTQDAVIAAGTESMTRGRIFFNTLYHQREGVGVGPFSDRIKQRFGIETFSQFEGEAL